jgi:diaminopimelate decarboxylase
VTAGSPACLRSGETELLLEPGKLLTEPAAAVLTRVLLRNGADVVVDAALADVPEAAYRPHPVAHLVEGRWRPLGVGTGRMLGRSCMESDILADGLDLTDLDEGDLLALGSCGAYDQSMSYTFGRGARGK